MKQIFSSYIYDNPLPQLRARNSAFCYACQLEDGTLLATHQIGEAFESVDGTTYISESCDGGRTWSEPRKAFDKSNEKIPITDNGKISRLSDGKLVILGYEFPRPNPDLPLGNPQTGGLLDDSVYFSVSVDNGKTWSEHYAIPNKWVCHTEASAPLYELKDGSWATPITGFPDWEGKPYARNCGRLLRSFDKGNTWNDDTVCMEFDGDTVTCYEQRLCQTTDGTLVVIGWNEDTKTGKRLNNHVTFSFDNGKTFTKPVDTGIGGQASSLLALDDNKVLSIHAIRRDTDKPGIYACIADINGGKWNVISNECVWSPNVPIIQDKKMAEVFAFLKFGQPSCIKLNDGKILLTHWVCEEGCYKTLATVFEL